MSRLPDSFIQDRELRDAARAVFLDDVEHARTSLTGKAVAERVVGRIGTGAKDVFEVAKGHTDDKRGLIACLIAAIALWFTRKPLLEIFGIAQDIAEDIAEDIADDRADQDVEIGDPDDQTDIQADRAETESAESNMTATSEVSEPDTTGELNE